MLSQLEYWSTGTVISHQMTFYDAFEMLFCLRLTLSLTKSQSSRSSIAQYIGLCPTTSSQGWRLRNSAVFTRCTVKEKTHESRNNHGSIFLFEQHFSVAMTCNDQAPLCNNKTTKSWKKTFRFTTEIASLTEQKSRGSTNSCCVWPVDLLL